MIDPASVAIVMLTAKITFGISVVGWIVVIVVAWLKVRATRKNLEDQFKEDRANLEARLKIEREIVYNKDRAKNLRKFSGDVRLLIEMSGASNINFVHYSKLTREQQTALKTYERTSYGITFNEKFRNVRLDYLRYESYFKNDNPLDWAKLHLFNDFGILLKEINKRYIDPESNLGIDSADILNTMDVLYKPLEDLIKYDKIGSRNHPVFCYDKMEWSDKVSEDIEKKEI